MSLTWWNCDRGVLSGLIPFGHEMTIGLRVPPKCAATSLVDRNGVLPAHAQPAWYMLSIFGPPRAGKPADLVQRRDLLLDRVRDVVLGEQFADAPLLAFGARAVVAPDVEDDGVVAEAELLQPVHQLADLGVGVLDEPGEHLHQPPLERPLRLGDAVPRRHRVGSRRQLRVGGNPAELLLPREDALAVLVPAVVELAFVLVGPLREDVVRAVDGARRPVHQERLVGRERLVPLEPGEALVDHVFGQVVFLAVRRLDRR